MNPYLVAFNRYLSLIFTFIICMFLYSFFTIVNYFYRILFAKNFHFLYYFLILSDFKIIF